MYNCVFYCHCKLVENRSKEEKINICIVFMSLASAVLALAVASALAS